ncbi:hypothetical protein [Agriterribacter sp.]|uniref:hypothetical protein n=1 Tax=Agriterribacter sp. TaxID=2821509 RepID=UPI002C6855DB|nr:hypothetical protein [Agriterribacter sp.]HRO47449.1 hypothetical protein [Agriterribacter sp.]HRQ15894.1 hypothetical protein [Agriterribacter sp.]
MSHLNEHISRVNEKLQLLLKQHHTLLKENIRLKQDLEQIKLSEQTIKEKAAWLQQQVEIAKISSGQAGQEVKSELEKRVNAYIKEIDQCIALLVNQ